MKVESTHMVVGLIMLISAVTAVLLKPTDKLADQGSPVELAAMIPRAFQGWRVEPGHAALIVNPKLADKVDKLYNQTLARTYVDGEGDSIMLSIAYGGNQADQSLQVHRPEFCYTAQGFHITGKTSGHLKTPWGTLPVRRLVATRGARKEPITYWITVGHDATLPGIGRKLLQLKYGLTGRIPDGMLVRVSSIGGNEKRAYAQQQQFILAMFTAIADGHSGPAQRHLTQLGVL